MKQGDTFKMTEEALDNYGEEYRDKIFTVSHVATSKEDHPGYDEAADGMKLYDADELKFSLYEYEVEQV